MICHVAYGQDTDASESRTPDHTSYRRKNSPPCLSMNSGNNGAVNQNVIAAMNCNMKQAGYKLDRDNPDVLIVLNAHYDPEVSKEVEPVYANPEKPEGADTISAYYDPHYYWKYAEFNDILGYKIIKNEDKKAGLAIEIIDRKSEKIIWRGTAKEPLDQKGSSTKIAKYVDAVFEEFPASTHK